jgi:DNA-directed RNA polymerase specialized sigma24 family protein
MSEYIDEPEDEALVRRARGGEAAAFVQLSMRWWTPLYRIGWYLLGSKSGAAQVAEATLLQALRSPGSLPAGVPLRTFVLRLAVRLAMKRRPSSSRVLEHQIEAEGLPQALKRVDDADRAAFVLREVERLSPEEAAAVLCTSPEDIRARTHRVYLFLMGFLGQTAPELDFSRSRTI